jgi:hypothetical protein
MSGDGRSARPRGGAEPAARFVVAAGPWQTLFGRQRQPPRRPINRQQRRCQMNVRTNRARVGKARMGRRIGGEIGRRGRVARRDRNQRKSPGHRADVNMAEGQGKMDRKREEREPATDMSIRAEPAHPGVNPCLKQWQRAYRMFGTLKTGSGPNRHKIRGNGRLVPSPSGIE